MDIKNTFRGPQGLPLWTFSMLDVVYESMTCPRKAIMLSPVNEKKKKALYEPGAFICFLIWLQR